MTLIIIAAFTKKSFPFWGGAFWEPLVSNTYIPLFQVYFHHTGCPKEWKLQWNWLKFEIYDLIQSIFWDTLYGENTIQISIYVFGTKGSPKAQPNKEKLFLESNYNAHISKFLAYFMAFSIFLDTLYVQNRLRIILSIYFGPKAPKKLHLINEIFSAEQLYWLMSYTSLFAHFTVFSIF